VGSEARGSTGARWTESLTEEDCALLGVGETDADDFDAAMVLGVCHKIDRHADHKIRPYDLAADKRLEALLTRLGASLDVSESLLAGCHGSVLAYGCE